ncbi:site-specific integrase [Mycolicibacter terrae]|uniref:Site-specific integrase n=1 Tax=Mycolicibacter terrae TaxID=1788 RepID=A0ACD2ES61_9MYCO|nr:site-specific integrase [Mycolicibacter terrae]
MDRRGNHEGSITKRPNGTYQGRMRYTDPHTGLPKRVSVYGKTSQEVRDKLQEVRERLAIGAPARDAKDTVAQWLRVWCESSLEASDRKATTKQLYAAIARKHLMAKTIGEIRLDRLRPSHVEAMIVELRRQGLADSTVRQVYVVLRAALDSAVRDGLIGKNPAATVQRPRVERHEAHVLAPSDVRRVLACARRSRYYAVVLAIASCALRRGEACALAWRDVDLDNAELTVTHTLALVDGQLKLTTPKSKRSRRRIPMTPELVTELRAIKKRQKEERLRLGPSWGGRHDMVFTTEMGTLVSPRNILRVVENAAKAAGLEGVGAHTLRHSAATAWLEAGVHIKAVADLLGHGSIAVTGDLYGHTSQDQARNAVASLGMMLANTKGVNEGRTEEETTPHKLTKKHV